MRTWSGCSPHTSHLFGVASVRKSRSNWFKPNGGPLAHVTEKSKCCNGASRDPCHGLDSISQVLTSLSDKLFLCSVKKGPEVPGLTISLSAVGIWAICSSQSRCSARGGGHSDWSDRGHRPTPGSRQGLAPAQITQLWVGEGWFSTRKCSQKWQWFVRSRWQMTSHPCLLDFTVMIKSL